MARRAAWLARHRVRLSKAASSAAAAEEKGGKSRAIKELGSTSKETMDVDLNEAATQSSSSQLSQSMSSQGLSTARSSPLSMR